MLVIIQFMYFCLLVYCLKTEELEHHILCVGLAAILHNYKTWFPTGRYKTEETGGWEEYLKQGGGSDRRLEKNCIMSIFIICVLHKILFV